VVLSSPGETVSMKAAFMESETGAAAGIDGAACDMPCWAWPPQRLAAKPSTQRMDELACSLGFDSLQVGHWSRAACLQQLSPFLSQQHDLVLVFGFSRLAASRTNSGAHTWLVSAQASFSALL